MSSPAPASRPVAGRHTSRAGLFLVMSFALFAAPGISGCSTHATEPAWTAHPAAATPTGQGDDAAMAVWAARPEYARADARTEEAYAFAMAAPAVLEWMPCYCGCGSMGHGSNLDCFFKPTMEGLTGLVFEEHASYCAICIDTALMAKRMLGEGQSLRAIRDAVDAEFGDAGPGTTTELPPA